MDWTYHKLLCTNTCKLWEATRITQQSLDTKAENEVTALTICLKATPRLYPCCKQDLNYRNSAVRKQISLYKLNRTQRDIRNTLNPETSDSMPSLPPLCELHGGRSPRDATQLRWKPAMGFVPAVSLSLMAHIQCSSPKGKENENKKQS